MGGQLSAREVERIGAATLARKQALEDEGMCEIPDAKVDLSLVVAVYNQVQFLPWMFWSIENQRTSGVFEVVFCDDGSTDRAFDELRDWSNRNPSIDMRYVWQPDAGFRLSRSRNNGARCARGRVLVFVDCDSLLGPYFLQDHLEAHAVENRIVCGAAPEVTVAAKGFFWESAFVEELLAQHSGSLQERVDLLGGQRPWMACTGGNFSVAAKQFVEFDEHFEGWGSEDRDVAYRLFSSGLAVYLIPRTGCASIRLAGYSAAWSPAQGASHDSIVAALKGKLRLKHKHSMEVMEHSLELVRSCHLDRNTNRWYIAPPNENTTIEEVLNVFSDWLKCNDVGDVAR